MHIDRLRLKRDQVLREEVDEETSSQVDTNQSSTSNVKADVISDEGSETDEIDNDVNLGARRKNLELKDSLNGCKVISSGKLFLQQVFFC